MTELLAWLDRIIRFSASWRLAFYRLVETILDDLDSDVLRAQVKDAVAHDRRTQALEAGAVFGPEVQSVDARVDDILREIRDRAATQVLRGEATPATASRAKALLTTVFPDGLAAVISMPYADQAKAVQAIVDTLNTGEMQEAVHALGLDAEVAALDELAREYGAAVRLDAGAVDAETIRDADRKGQIYFRDTLAMLFRVWSGVRGSERMASL